MEQASTRNICEIFDGVMVFSLHNEADNSNSTTTEQFKPKETLECTVH